MVARRLSPRRSPALQQVMAVGAAVTLAATVAVVPTGVLISGPSASAATITVGLSTPLYDSPGALVPTIVTVYGPPLGHRAALTVSASRGARVTCTGETWSNPFDDTVSRKCCIQPPPARGPVQLTGRAVLTRRGAPSIVGTGSGRPVEASGYRTGTITVARACTIERCQNTGDYGRLTFDDGASATQLDSILETLMRNRVRGTFFFRGDWAASHPRLFRRIEADGHWIGNHTHSHPPLSKQSPDVVLGQIRRGTIATNERSCCDHRSGRDHSLPASFASRPNVVTRYAAGPPTLTTGTTRRLL
jgi:hypothetical protein